MRVTAQTLLYVRAEERYVLPGEAFDYPDGPNLQILLDLGFVVPAAIDAGAPETPNGGVLGVPIIAPPDAPVDAPPQRRAR